MTDKELLDLLGEEDYTSFKNNKEWWAERQALEQDTITEKNIEEIEQQLAKYYRRTLDRVTKEMELTYNTYLLNVERGLQSSPATLYKLDSYWTMQAQIRDELQKLGDKQSVLFSRQFTNQYRQIYKAAAIVDNMGGFGNISAETALQMINEIWCADGSTWTQRIWNNTERLQEALNDGLIECVVGGRPSAALKNRLMEEFNVSFSRADNIVRTEMAHIQTQAARKRYEDSGIKQVQVWADKDERRCEICGKLHQQKFPVGAQMPIPAHPRCRCRIIPVIEIDPVENEQLKLDGF